MSDQPTTGDLVKAKAITSDEITAAVDALLAKPNTASYPVGGGYLLDLAAALKAHEPSYRAVHNGDRTDAFKRTMARTAILLARPEKA